MRTESSSSRPLAFATTAPPPAVPSTWTCPRDSVAFSTASRILPALRIRSARLPRLLNTSRLPLGVRSGKAMAGPRSRLVAGVAVGREQAGLEQLDDLAD